MKSMEVNVILLNVILLTAWETFEKCHFILRDIATDGFSVSAVWYWQKGMERILTGIPINYGFAGRTLPKLMV